MQPRGDHRLEVFEDRPCSPQAGEDRHAPDMHRHFRRFQVQKRRVHRGQLFASLMFPPGTLTPALWCASGVQTVLELRTWSGLCISGRICNGKRPRSIKLAEFALGLANRSATATGGGVDPQAHVTGKVNLDVFSGSEDADAGPPVTMPSRANRSRWSNRQIA